MGDQLVLEGLQCCLAHNSLRELVPQDDGSWEEALFIQFFDLVRYCHFGVSLVSKYSVSEKKKKETAFQLLSSLAS